MKTFKTTIISAACVTSALLLAACSNDDMPNGKTTTQINAAENIEFSLSFSDYNAEDTVNHATRAAMDAELAKPRIVPMGDMMYAEVSLQRDTTKATPKEKAAATRALTDGTYTIYAYQGTTLKGTLTGIVSSNVFTPTSSNQEIGLEPGTYTFVCCNDKVNVSGETWTIDRANLENARIGIAAGQVITATPRKQKVAFEMKYVGSRAKIQLVADGFPLQNITSTFTSTSNIAASVNFNPATQTYTNASTEALAVTPDYGSYDSQVKNSQYVYFFPGTAGSQLKLTLTGGTAYRMPVAGRTVLFPALALMAANGSYTLQMALHYNYIYLYSDGTTGQYTDAAHSGKTPIGIVVSRSKRLAVALKNAAEGVLRQQFGSPVAATLWSASALQNTQSLTTMSSNIAAHIADFKGEDYTWTSTYSTDGKVKGNEAADYPAFYAAAHYDPGVPVTGSNVGKWFLPTLGEWNLLSRNLNLEIVDLPLITTYTSFTNPPRPGAYPSGLCPVDYGFRRASGNVISAFASTSGQTDVQIPLLSSEYDASNYIAPIAYSRRDYSFYYIQAMLPAHLINKRNSENAYASYYNDATTYIVRPFVHY
ncbi:hypothetical protein [Prevotella pallens]|jgi:hypothetical protein|uniref:hypothetical protein n=1 Tax=Prevotella pallens TaxID=60133 RepID=UPI001CB1D678|nr:hypothetical protein [Prevotella pallens]MBF1508554.1 hypothetical protein [Prevotella pallens]MBF1510352.1 hypothetical protein [Prevotella pallens]